MSRRPQIWHWRQDDEIKNFGDYLADFLTHEMFEPISWHDGPVHVIGSVIADFLVPESDLTPDGRPQPKVVFWGCGARDEDGLSEGGLERSTILAVRGPKTASVLKLGAAKPQGDIAFFLPALYKQRRSRLTSGKSVCIPHFWDRRHDTEFAHAGCEVVLRTNIAGGGVEIRRLIDSISSADFVLTASLHGAVVAAAYGVPFAFWDNGHIDLPFKWEDLAAYLSIPCTFYHTIAEAKKGYEADLKPTLAIPPLWAFLACAPFPIRPAAMTKIAYWLMTTADATDAEADLQDLLEEFERSTPESNAAAENFMNRVATLGDAVADVRAQLDRAEAEKTRLLKLRDDIGGVLDTRDASLREKEEIITGLEARARTLSDRNQRLEDLYARATIEGADLKESLGSRDQEHNELTALHGRVVDEKTAAEARILDLGGEIDRIRLSLNEKIAETSVLAIEREQLRRGRDEAEASVRELRDRIAEGLQALAMARADHEALTARTAENQTALETEKEAIKANLERLTERAQGLRNEPYDPDPSEFGTPPDLQKLFCGVAQFIGDLQDRRQTDGENIQRLVGQTRKLTDDATAAWRQAAEARESLRAATQRVLEGELITESLLSRLRETSEELTIASQQRDALQITVGEQDRLLQNALISVAALSRQVALAGRDADVLKRRLDDAEATRQAAQRRYDKISNSHTWRWVRTTRKVREYFAPKRLRQRGRRLVRILTGKQKVKSAGGVTAPSPILAESLPAPSLSIFIVDIAPHTDARGARANVDRLAATGAQIIVCGDVEPWVGTPYLTVPSAPANIADHLDYHLKTSVNATTIVIFGAETEVSGDVASFAEVFRNNPTAVIASAVEIDAAGRVIAAGGRLTDAREVAAVGAGLSPTDFRLASVHGADLVWPVVVGIDADGFKHLGGLKYEDSGETALVALGLDTQLRGLDIVVNPFVKVVRRGETPPVQISSEIASIGMRPPARKPRVLFTDAVTPTPDRDSGSIDIYWYMRIFLDLGYEVTFLPIQGRQHAGRYTDALRMLGVRCPLQEDAAEAWIFLRDYGPDFDLILAYRASAACYVIDPIRQFAPQAKVVFDTVDLHFLREQRAAELSGSAHDMDQALRTRVEELKIMNLSDATILLSSLEYEHIGEIAPDVRRYLISIVRPVPGRTAPAAGRSGSMFVGGFKHAPNTDAALFLCSEVWPKVRQRDPSAELSIIGADVTPEIQALHDPAGGINVVGFVEDLEPFYKSMRVNLAPLRYGAGVKGKVAASLSVGLPTVATPTAVEGMFLEDGRDVLVRSDPDAFAEAVLKLSYDDALWRHLSDNAVKAAQETFSIEAAQSRLVTMLSDLGLPHG